MLENYNMSVARYMLHGVDIWMNNPRRPLEASGTSGQKAAIGKMSDSQLNKIEGSNYYTEQYLQEKREEIEQEEKLTYITDDILIMGATKLDKEDEVNGGYSNYKCVDLMHTGSMGLQFDFAYWMYPTSYEKGASFMSDDRDRQLYRTVTIGSQTWMAEDLRYGNMDNYEITQRCADYRAFLAIALKGAMYTWKQSKNACPSGWHLPSKAEFETLIETAGGMESANMALRSTEGWQANGLDSYGFSVKPYAKAGSENFSYYWTSTRVDYEFDQAFGVGMYDESGMRLNEVDAGSKFHVRCVKDAE